MRYNYKIYNKEIEIFNQDIITFMKLHIMNIIDMEINIILAIFPRLLLSYGINWYIRITLKFYPETTEHYSTY